MNIACLSVDPGGHTGVAWGVYNPGVNTWEALANVMLPGTVTVAGDISTQIRELGTLWSSFFNVTVRRALLPPERCYLVVEDFIYKPGTQYGGEDSKISTALIWGLEGYRLGRRDEWTQTPGRKSARKAFMPSMILQTASQAKSFATPQRFKDNNLWKRGYGGQDNHIFSAQQHIAYFLQSYRSKGLK